MPARPSRAGRRPTRSVAIRGARLGRVRYIVGMADLVSPASVSDFLHAECRERGELLTNLKLQKLLYYAQAWHLALRDAELFAENFEAWVHGPVLPSQYHRFKKFVWTPITDHIEKPKLSDEVSGHLIEIVDVFGTETAIALELMTHREKPWQEARGDLAPDAPSSAVIKKGAMQEYYRALGAG